MSKALKNKVKLNDMVSVKDFGAVGNGVADDTLAIQAALAASKSVFIPAGTYRVSSISVLYSGNDGYVVKGAGRNTTKLVADGTVSNFFTVGSPVALTGYGNYSTFEDFTIDMTSMTNSSSSRGLFLRDGYTHSFNRITIIGVANTNKVPLYIGNRVYACTFKDCDFWSSSVGTGGKVVMVGTPATVESTPTANSFINCAMQSVSMDTCANTSFFGCIIQGDETPKVTTTACRGTLFTGCDFEGGGTLYNLDTASANFRSIGNDITAFSGTYLGANLPGGGYTFNDAGFRVSASSGAPIQFDTVEYEGWKHLANVAGLQREVHKNTSTNVACAMDLAITANTKSLIAGLNQTNAYIESTDGSSFTKLISGGVGIAEWGQYSFRSGIDGSINLGDPTHRWGTVYAATGTINTSDQREKQDIADLDAAEKRVAVALKGLVKKFRFKDAVQKKGENARIHVGVIAQEVMAAFEAEGLDPMSYAIVCCDEWGAELDAEGNEVRPAGNRYGVRYEQLLAFIISAL